MVVVLCVVCRVWLCVVFKLWVAGYEAHDGSANGCLRNSSRLGRVDGAAVVSLTSMFI